MKEESIMAKMQDLPAVIIFLTLILTGAAFQFTRVNEEQSVIILTNSNGEEAEKFRVTDSVFGSFSGLLPETEYTIRVLQSNEKEISHAILTSDKRGIIPTIALWWDIGVEYKKSKTGKLKPDKLSRYTYRCLVQREEETVAEVPINVMSLEESGPIVYSSNKQGDPLSIFSHKKENVFISGRNFPPGIKLRMHVVSDRHSWKIGDRLDEPFAGSHTVIEVTLGGKQQDFITMLPWGIDMGIGSYDLVVEYVTDENELADNTIGANYAMDNYSTVFSIVIDPPKPYPQPLPRPHLEADLACQAPPQDPTTGTVIGAPNPTYKDFFGAEEEVWLAVNPSTDYYNYTFQNARLYVVDHRMKSQWYDGLVLSDVSGGYETIIVQPGSASVNYTRIWSNPTVRDEGYDVVVDFAPFGVYDWGQDIVDRLDDKGFVVPTAWVCLDSISFNHNSTSNEEDAINIRENHNEDVPVPEWVKAQETHPAAYIKNRTVKIKAVFSAGPGVNCAKIRATQQDGELGEILEKTVNFSGGTSGEVFFDVSLTTPHDIRYFFQGWDWYCEDINGTGGAAVRLAYTKNRVYNVLAQPQSPWTTSGQSEPWLDVLYKSTIWAWGQTTPEAAAGKITRQLFLNVGGRYGSLGYYNNGHFNLTNFLDNIPTIGDVNCLDMAMAVVTFSNVVGCDSFLEYCLPFGYLNCIKPIGRDWTNNPSYGQYGHHDDPIVPGHWSVTDGRSLFNSHAYGRIGDNIFDACLIVDTDSVPDYGPPFTETWIIDIPWTEYIAKVVDDDPGINTAIWMTPATQFSIY